MPDINIKNNPTPLYFNILPNKQKDLLVPTKTRTRHTIAAFSNN